MLEPIASRQPWSSRQEEILRLTRRTGSCAIADLAVRMQVSEETIRRDVRPLVQAGLLTKVHGAVMPPADSQGPLNRRMNENIAGKKAIAATVAELIADGDSVSFDSGSTATYVADALGAHANLTVVTHATEVARILSRTETNRIFLSGGELRAGDGAAFGRHTLEFLGGFATRTAVISANGLDPDRGLLDHHLRDAEVAQTLIENTQRVVLVADRSKFETRGIIRVCGFDRVDVMVTDAQPPALLRQRLEAAQVKLIVAPQLKTIVTTA